MFFKVYDTSDGFVIQIIFGQNDFKYWYFLQNC